MKVKSIPLIVLLLVLTIVPGNVVESMDWSELPEEYLISVPLWMEESEQLGNISVSYSYYFEGEVLRGLLRFTPSLMEGYHFLDILSFTSSKTPDDEEGDHWFFEESSDHVRPIGDHNGTVDYIAVYIRAINSDDEAEQVDLWAWPEDGGTPFTRVHSLAGARESARYFNVTIPTVPKLTQATAVTIEDLRSQLDNLNSELARVKNILFELEDHNDILQSKLEFYSSISYITLGVALLAVVGVVIFIFYRRQI